VSAGTASPEGRPARPGIADRLDGLINPILLKDIRSYLRSKLFLVVFFAAAILIQGATLLLTLVPESETGSILLTMLVSGLGFVLVGIMPAIMHGRFTEELSSGSTELALISRMTPGKLVRGKILSGLAASMLFFSAAGPSLTIAYMLGGVDLIVLVYIIVLLLLSSVAAMIAAILMVAIAGKRKLKILGFLLVIAGLGESSVLVGLSRIIAEETIHLEPMFWGVNAVLGGYMALLVLFFHTVAVSRLSFEADNRDLWPRVCLAALTVIPVLLVGIALEISARTTGFIRDADEFMGIWLLVSLAHFVFGLLFVLSTPDRMSGRVRSRASRLVPLRLVLYPGPGRLYAFILLVLAFFAAWTVGSWIVLDMDGEIVAVLLVAIFVTVPTMVGGSTLVHFGLTRIKTPIMQKLPRGLIVAVLLFAYALLGLPVGVIAEAAEEVVGEGEFLLAFHPLTALFLAADEPEVPSMALSVFGNAIVLVPAMVYWIVEIVRALVDDMKLTMDQLGKRPRAEVVETDGKKSEEEIRESMEAAVARASMIAAAARASVTSDAPEGGDAGEMREADPPEEPTDEDGDEDDA